LIISSQNMPDRHSGQPTWVLINTQKVRHSDTTKP